MAAVIPDWIVLLAKPISELRIGALKFRHETDFNGRWPSAAIT